MSKSKPARAQAPVDAYLIVVIDMPVQEVTVYHGYQEVQAHADFNRCVAADIPCRLFGCRMIAQNQANEG